MARFKTEASLGKLGNISDFVDGVVNPTVATATSLTLVDAEGDGFTLFGTGLTYGLSGVTGGTFTGLRVFDAAGNTLQTGSGFSFAAAPMVQVFTVAGIGAAVLQMLGGNDLVLGSRVGDKLLGGFGNDTIKGAGGADLILGSTGRDKLFGEAGADTFFFVAGDGRDRIMDFTDTGGTQDDMIALRQRQFNAMVIEETLTGVTLHFGAKGTIVVDGWHAVDVDSTDFLLG